MSYFSQFREIPYGFFVDSKTEDYREATDITFRFKIIEYVRNSKITNFSFYRVEDGDRPDIVSQKLYDRPDLHWLLFLYNDMLNPIFEWPMSSIQVQQNTIEKYKGSSIFLNLYGIQRFDEPEQSKTCRANVDNFELEKYRIQVGQEVHLYYGSGSDQRYEGRILGYDYSLGELRVDFPTNDFGSDENRVDLNSYQKIELRTKDEFDQDVVVDIKRNCFKKMTKESRFSINRFEKNGVFLNPLEYYSRVLDDTFDQPWGSEKDLNTVLSINQGSTTYLNDLCFKDTLLGKYILEENTNFVVTNDTHELTVNEKNREILVPSPSSISSILKDISKILKR